MYVAYDMTDKENVEMNENRYNENAGDPIMGDELEEWMKSKKFDYCIMNPPYCRSLHLRVLEAVSKHVEKEIVNLSPIVNYVTRKNAFSDMHIKKFNEQPLKDHCKNIERLSLNTMARLFRVGPTNTIGIQHYVLNEKYDITPTTFVPGDAELIRKIMSIAMKDSVKLHTDGRYILNISPVHGHQEEDSKDKFCIMNSTWEAQLATKGKTTIRFDSETDAHDFYVFWMSKYGIQLTKLWKCDIHIHTQYIPYFWAKKGDEKDAIMKHFNLSEKEFETLMNM